jgi:hypothetical protein
MAFVRHAAALAALLVTAGCSTATPSVNDAPEATPVTEPSRSSSVTGLGAPGQELAAGRYTREGFEPRITFAVDDGWTAEQAAYGFFDLQDAPGSLDVVAVQFANVEGDGSAADVIADIQANPQLRVGQPESVVIGGLDGTRVVVETTDPPETDPPVFRPVLVVPAGPLSIASGRRLRVDLFDTPSGVLAILVGGSVAQWDRAVELSMPVLDSVTIGE